MPVRPAIVHLIGPPGVGKLTVATAFASLAATHDWHVVVLDNHLVNDAVLSVLGVDGVKPVPEGAWERIALIREIVIETIEQLSPVGWSFVFTSFLVEGEAADAALIARLRRLASVRKSTYRPIELRCAMPELLRRVPLPARRERKKWVDPEGVRSFLENNQLMVPHDARSIDTTAQSPEVSASVLLEMVQDA